MGRLSTAWLKRKEFEGQIIAAAVGRMLGASDSQPAEEPKPARRAGVEWVSGGEMLAMMGLEL